LDRDIQAPMEDAILQRIFTAQKVTNLTNSLHLGRLYDACYIDKAIPDACIYNFMEDAILRRIFTAAKK